MADRLCKGVRHNANHILDPKLENFGIQQVVQMIVGVFPFQVYFGADLHYDSWQGLGVGPVAVHWREV